jgi:hypothetical protein
VQRKKWPYKTGDLLKEVEFKWNWKSLNFISKLDPRLSEAEELDLIKTSIDCVYPLPPGGLAVKKGKEESYDKTLEAEVLLQATIDALHDLLKEMLIKDLSPNGLNTVFKVT